MSYNSNNKVIFVGPIPGIITGQSLAFNSLITNTNLQRLLINSDTQGYSIIMKILRFILVILQSVFYLLMFNPTGIYISCTRTKFGSIKDIILILLCYFFGVNKIVVHLHGLDFLSFRDCLIKVQKYLLDYAYSKTTDVVVLHESMISQFNVLPVHVNRHVVYNFFSEELIGIKQPIVSNYNTLKILFLSNMMMSKGVEDLIDAVKQYNTSGGNAELICAGIFLDDHFETAVQMEKRLKNKWDENIKYKGLVFGASKLKLLEWANILAIPSYAPSEAFPLCIAEGMIAGCFIIATKHNFLPEIVNKNVGCIVDIKSPDSICDCLNKINDNKKKLAYTGNKNYETAIKKYTVNQHVSLIDKILSS